MKIFAILLLPVFLVSCGTVNNSSSEETGDSELQDEYTDMLGSDDVVVEIENNEEVMNSEIDELEAEWDEQREVSAGLNFVWLSEEEAMELASENNIPFRVIMRDGEMLSATMDYRPGRINAEVEDAIVVDFSIE